MTPEFGVILPLLLFMRCPGGLVVKNPSQRRRLRDAYWIPSWEDALEQGMATHSSVLAWRIPWTEEPGGLHSPWGCKELDSTEVIWQHH